MCGEPLKGKKSGGIRAWSAKTYKGPYVYVGDIVRGFDVFKWTGEGPAPWEAPPAG